MFFHSYGYVGHDIHVIQHGVTVCLPDKFDVRI